MTTYKSVVDKLLGLQFYNNLMWENTSLKEEINQLEQEKMRNQFFYTMEYQVAPGAPTRANAEPITMRRMASFNIDKVIRSVETEDGKLIVILDDFHEEKKQALKHNANGKPIAYVDTQMLQSEIHLLEEDKIRFRQLTSLPEPISIDVTQIPVTTDGV